MSVSIEIMTHLKFNWVTKVTEMMVKSGVVHTCNCSTQEADAEDHMF